MSGTYGRDTPVAITSRSAMKRPPSALSTTKRAPSRKMRVTEVR
jgi:hypothetical protein